MSLKIDEPMPLATLSAIEHLLTAPRRPTTTGKIERLHKTMRKELFDRRRAG